MFAALALSIHYRPSTFTFTFTFTLSLPQSRPYLPAFAIVEPALTSSFSQPRAGIALRLAPSTLAVPAGRRVRSVRLPGCLP
jgi:hypothetical protein